MENTKLSFTSNVLVRSVNKKTGITTEKVYSNRVTKATLLGITRFLYGDFNSSSSSTQASAYTPKYLALGGYSGPTPAVPQDANSVNATSLTNELTDGSYASRFEIASKIISNEIANEYTKLTMKIFVPNTALVGAMINEAGLFATKTGDTCLARVQLDNIKKDRDTTIDVIWDITIRSISNKQED